MEKMRLMLYEKNAAYASERPLFLDSFLKLKIRDKQERLQIK
jgi:hypothetical protein